MKTKHLSKLMILIALFAPILSSAQTTEFTYQGNLRDGANPANGSYDLEFKLYDAVSAGNLIGTQTRAAVVVSSGVFAVRLDFPSASSFPGGDRYLEVAVKPAGSPNPYTLLSPRQRVGSSPYAVRSLNAGNADNAGNASQLGGIAAGQYVLTTDPRMSDARSPLPGSSDYIRNGTSPQSANISISGNLVAGQISGSGAGITNLNGANLQNGSVTAAKLAPDVLLGEPSPTNADLVAMKRWDRLGELRVFVLTVAVDDLVWDGQTFWILDTAGNRVHKLNPGAFTVAATYQVGTQPVSIVFDGANIWTANRGSNNLTKLRASDGANIGTISLGTPVGILGFDGTNIWANVGSPTNTQVAKVRASDGALLGTFSCNATVSAMAFDGANIWCGGAFNIQKIRALDGVGTIVPSSSTSSLVFDGRNVWSTTGGGSLLRLSGNGSALNNYATCTSSPGGLAFDGKDVLVICQGSQQIYRHSAVDGSLIGAYSLPFDPGVKWAFDGKHLWLPNDNPGDRLIRLSPPIR